VDRACWSGQWVSKVSWSVSKSVREGDGSVEAWEERREGEMGGWMDGGVHGLGFLNSFTFASSPSLSLSPSPSPSLSLSFSISIPILCARRPLHTPFCWLGVGDLWNCLLYSGV